MKTKEVEYTLAVKLTEVNNMIVVHNRQKGSRLGTRDIAFRKEFFDKKCAELGGADWVFNNPTGGSQCYDAITQRDYMDYVSGSQAVRVSAGDEEPIVDLILSGREHLVVLRNLGADFLIDTSGNNVMRKFCVWVRCGRYGESRKEISQRVERATKLARSNPLSCSDVSVSPMRDGISFTYMPKDREEFDLIAKNVGDDGSYSQAISRFIVREIMGWPEELFV